MKKYSQKSLKRFKTVKKRKKRNAGVHTWSLNQLSLKLRIFLTRALHHLEHRCHHQEASNPMPDFHRRAIMVYGIPPLNDPSPSSCVEHDISKLRLYFSTMLAEDGTVSVCMAYRVGAMGTNDDSQPNESDPE